MSFQYLKILLFFCIKPTLPIRYLKPDDLVWHIIGWGTRMKPGRLGQFLHSGKGLFLRNELPCNKTNECDSRVVALSLTAFLDIVLSRHISPAEAGEMSAETKKEL